MDDLATQICSKIVALMETKTGDKLVNSVEFTQIFDSYNYSTLTKVLEQFDPQGDNTGSGRSEFCGKKITKSGAGVRSATVEKILLKIREIADGKKGLFPGTVAIVPATPVQDPTSPVVYQNQPLILQTKPNQPASYWRGVIYLGGVIKRMFTPGYGFITAVFWLFAMTGKQFLALLTGPITIASTYATLKIVELIYGFFEKTMPEEAVNRLKAARESNLDLNVPWIVVVFGSIRWSSQNKTKITTFLMYDTKIVLMMVPYYWSKTKKKQVTDEIVNGPTVQYFTLATDPQRFYVDDPTLTSTGGSSWLDAVNAVTFNIAFWLFNISLQARLNMS